MNHHHKASFYLPQEDHKVRCTLCPHNCIISPGKEGICRVRINHEGELMTTVYGRICSSHFDPVEKKPLYHFHPGKEIYSIGSLGCNLRCKFCQNWEISQTGTEDHPYLHQYSPEQIVRNALSHNENIGIAYTYNEPAVWFEFMKDTAIRAKETGLLNAMVTNGFINPAPLLELVPFMDAFSVDLKGFTEAFYKSYTSSGLQPVLDTLLLLKKCNKHIEITNLVITNANDDPGDFRRMVDWIANHLGRDTVLHISRYFPMYEMTHEMTPVATLRDFYHIARQSLHYVYIGNVIEKEGQNTYCPGCRRIVISRVGYITEVTGLDSDGNCIYCDHNILDV
ncbi:MAG: AmmeMemoRadiSam system radical SAM enzyme [Bacteroidales bacterium]|nr:AmmeMemoRadiSam system radical SAM enzyme [Bacteroidales bacterium]